MNKIKRSILATLCVLVASCSMFKSFGTATRDAPVQIGISSTVGAVLVYTAGALPGVLGAGLTAYIVNTFQTQGRTVELYDEIKTLRKLLAERGVDPVVVERRVQIPVDRPFVPALFWGCVIVGAVLVAAYFLWKNREHVGGILRAIRARAWGAIGVNLKAAAGFERSSVARERTTMVIDARRKRRLEPSQPPAVPPAPPKLVPVDPHVGPHPEK